MSPEYILSSVKWQGTLAPFWQAGPPNIFLRLVNRPSTFWTCKKYKSYSSMSIGIQDIIYCCCSVAQSCLTLCYLMDGTTPGLPFLHYFPEFAQTHICWVCDVILPSYPATPFSSCSQSFPASGSFPMTLDYNVWSVFQIIPCFFYACSNLLHPRFSICFFSNNLKKLIGILLSSSSL